MTQPDTKPCVICGGTITRTNQGWCEVAANRLSQDVLDFGESA